MAILVEPLWCKNDQPRSASFPFKRWSPNAIGAISIRSNKKLGQCIPEKNKVDSRNSLANVFLPGKELPLDQTICIYYLEPSRMYNFSPSQVKHPVMLNILSRGCFICGRTYMYLVYDIPCFLGIQHANGGIINKQWEKSSIFRVLDFDRLQWGSLILVF